MRRFTDSCASVRSSSATTRSRAAGDSRDAGCLKVLLRRVAKWYAYQTRKPLLKNARVTSSADPKASMALSRPFGALVVFSSLVRHSLREASTQAKSVSSPAPNGLGGMPSGCVPAMGGRDVSRRSQTGTLRPIIRRTFADLHSARSD